MEIRRFISPALALLVFSACGCAHLVNGVYGIKPLEYRVSVERDVMVFMRDGVLLATDVYHPVGLDKSPVILVRTPYGKHVEGMGGLLNDTIVKIFAGHGYTVVVQDCRGRYHSEGEFYPFINESADGHDAAAWAAAQPWSSGRLGSWGGSYFGYTQWTMADNDSALAAMIPVVTSAEITCTMYEGGCLNLANILSWSTLNAGDGRGEVTEDEIRRGFSHLPLLTADDEVVGSNVNFYDDVVTYQSPEVMAPVSYRDRYQNVSAPVYSIAGWYDLFQKYQIEDFKSLREQGMEPARSMSRIVIGPWGHGVFSRPPVKFPGGGIIKLGQVDRIMDFFGEMLRGENNGVEDWPVYSVYVMGKNEWTGFDEWPPPGVRPVEYYLHSGGRANTRTGDGKLDTTLPGQESADDFVYDPADPAPTTGGPLLGADLGPKDQKEVEGRDDVLVYTSEPLTSPLLLLGPVSMTLFASSNAPDTDFTAKLCDVFPNGLSVNITDGVIRARFRNGDYHHPELIEPGRTYEYVIDLWHTAYQFQPGHRIRVQVSSSNFPRFDRNLNTGADIAAGLDMRSAAQAVYHEGETASRLTLPVADR